MKTLAVLLDGQLAGEVVATGDRLAFRYDEAWRQSADGYPLSLSMPLTTRDHPHAAINAFIWNLLPDNERTLDRWARQFHVSARNGFALIGGVGEDCAGAVQFVTPDRVDAATMTGDVAWIDEADIGARLRSVLDDAASGRTAADNGQFSLAGAQPKTALLFDGGASGGRWGVPSGRTPTTHILKPPAPVLPGHAENEHFCLTLAAAIGLTAARSQVRRFDGQLAIVVERYDRVQLGDGPDTLLRIHQEDMCQALGVLPWHKYQNDGGPTAADIVRLIRTSSFAYPTADDDDAAEDDVHAFVDSLIFNWIIGGTDAHAKNYGFLIGGEGTIRLCPLYDIASAYGFADIAPQRMRLAMKIEHYHVERVTVRHWVRWAEDAGLDPDAVVARIARMAAVLPDAVAMVVAGMRADGLEHAAIDRIVAAVTRRAVAIGAECGAGASPR